MKNFILILLLFVSIISSEIYSDEIENFIIVYKSKGFITEKKKTDIKKGNNVLYFFINDEGILKHTIFVTFEKNGIKNLSYKFIDNYIPGDIIGKKIKIFLESRIIEGEVLSDLNEIVLKTNSSIYKINKDKISYIEYSTKDFSSLTPGNLIVKFDSKEQKAAVINLNYFTGSFLWLSNYNFIFNEDENELRMDLGVNIKNQGNKSYKNSKIYIVSGDVKTDFGQPKYERFLLKTAEIQSDKDENITQQKLSDFYEYDIKGIYDIEAKQDITVYILKNSSIKFSKEYVYNSAIDNEGVSAVFTILNIKENNLGYPLPAGEASMFIEKNGVLHFTGKDYIKDTPEKEKIELKSGRVFDIKVERKHVFTEKISNNVWEEKYSLIFKNHKNNKIKIRALERINSVYWEIRESSHNYKKVDNQTIEFEIDIEPQKSVEILYKVRKRY